MLNIVSGTVKVNPGPTEEDAQVAEESCKAYKEYQEVEEQRILLTQKCNIEEEQKVPMLSLPSLRETIQPYSNPSGSIKIEKNVEAL